jgi:hypothetical protein
MHNLSINSDTDYIRTLASHENKNWQTSFYGQHNLSNVRALLQNQLNPFADHGVAAIASTAWTGKGESE